MNYKSHKLDSYLKHDDLQDRYIKLLQERRQPNGHILSRQPPKINHFPPPIVVENLFFMRRFQSQFLFNNLLFIYNFHFFLFLLYLFYQASL